VSLPELPATGAIPSSWVARFGALERIGCHAGVQVLRVAEPNEPALAFVKVHDAAERGAREAAVLRRGLPVVAPRLLCQARSAGGQVVLGLDDVRRDRDGRCRRLDAAVLPRAAALLARVHDHRQPELSRAVPTAMGWARQLQRRAAQHELAPPLKQAFDGLLVMGDGLCHQDLHPSNWVLAAGQPVGLLDWASAGFADPESDLAGLVLAAGGAPAHVDTVCTAWERDRPDRPIDRAKVWLLLYLEVLEAVARKGPGRAADDLQHLADQLVADWSSLPPLQGTRRVGRVVPASAETAPTHPLWQPVPTDQAQLVIAALARALPSLAVDAVHRFAGHACNDVLRLSCGDTLRVAKIYNKSVIPQLFELETALAARLTDTGAVVLAPLSLDHGGPLFRVGGRPAALYPYAGDERCGSTAIDRRRLAAAQAALHGLDPTASPLASLPATRPELIWTTVEAASRAALGPDLLAQLHEVWCWADEDMAAAWERLPRALLHGSLHRDHAGWWPGRGVVLYDLEKMRRGPRVADVVNTAYFMGYRGNDEQADPAVIVHYLRAYHRRASLTPAERAVVPQLLLGCFLHDLKALAQAGEAPARQRAHGQVTAEFFHNREGIRTAVAQYLPDP